MRKFSDSGQTKVEYALVLALIALLVIGVVLLALALHFDGGVYLGGTVVG